MILSIVYEDSDLIVINKPSGLITHPKNKTDTSKSVVSWLLEKYPSIKNIGEDPLRPGVVHRIDKYTSGLLIISKTQKSFDYLKNQFKERKIEKTYIALVHGKLKDSSGVIKSPLGKIGIKQTTKIKGKKELKGKEAITEYKVKKRFNNYTLLEIYPKTGRTHQIRVHLKSIYHPIVGDVLYGKKVENIKINRLFLHAFQLKLVTLSGKNIFIQTDLPEELTGILSSLNLKN